MLLNYTYNNPKLKERRKELRKSQTKAEEILWQYLHAKKLNGYKFYRQYSVDIFILDFYCPKLRFGIEIDGKHHTDSEVEEYDKQRTDFLNGLEIKIIRFSNDEVLSNELGVVEKVKEEIRNLIE
jgi:very-short-patch-repair endonuclease